MTENEAMTILAKHKILLTGFGLAAVLQLPLLAQAQSEHEGHHPEQQAPAQQDARPATGEANKSQRPPQMQMDHDDMDHERMMQQMHEQHMGNGHMDHDSKAPEKHSRPAAKERKDAE